MEVHHHQSHEKKNWKSYFWEFIMLFLAVFCGSLAEYRLEHTIEREREKEYMRSMVYDLASDTVELNGQIDFVNVIVSGLDSLSRALYATDDVKENTLLIYRLNATYLRRIGTSFRDETFTQLRNSGMMRLIRNHELSSEMGDYWSRSTGIERIQESIRESLNEVQSYGDEIINRSYYTNFAMRDSASNLMNVTINEHATLLTEEKNKLIVYANKIFRIKTRMERFYTMYVIQQKESANNLIRLIKDEYHFD